ncbi:hypothetical protein OEJ37_19455 [Burkholderia sp. BKH01]|uniref:hypothetical protein n=1 Tax=Burkholderia sp. BKH01 TaxID=2769262 RepID=UPI0021E06A42|nr:hypothetical protein [Burkholderia sp. BKH01]MCU9955537.1 hypothetical protein [Burkholderia sp. BKH01]
MASPHSVLTVLSHRPVDELVDNHERYARLHGCRHAMVDGMHVYGERQQVLHKYHAIIAQLVAIEPGALLLVLDPFSVVFDPHALPDVARGYDAIVTTQTSKSSLPAASGMIDAHHIVDAMTLASSPVYAVRDSRFVHFPAQHNRYRAVTMRVWGRLSHQR